MLLNSARFSATRLAAGTKFRPVFTAVTKVRALTKGRACAARRGFFRVTKVSARDDDGSGFRHRIVAIESMPVEG